MGYVAAVNVGVARTGEWTGRKGSSGIDKRPVQGPIVLDGPGVDGAGSGVRGDVVVDTRHHGGPDQAVYAFDSEDLEFWSAELGSTLGAGKAGENLTVTDMDCSNAVVGERWRVGTAVLRVTCPRIPCRVFAGFWDVPGLVKRFTVVGRTGAYLAVETRGEIRAGDEIEVLSRPAHGVTVAETFRFVGQGRRDLVEHIARALPDLPADVVERVNAVVG